MEEDPSSFMKEDKPKIPLVISFLTEVFGTTILMWMGCLGCIYTYNIGPVIPAFAFGLAVTSVIQIFGHISPIHINPAVSLGVLILGKMHWMRFIVYLLGQYVGAMFGFFLLWATMPYTEQTVCLLKVNSFANPLKAFFIEYFATMILMFVVASVVDPANSTYKDSLSLKLGMVVAGLVFSVEPSTGACLNPARSLPPCVFYNDFINHWLYQIGPFAGMATAAAMYRFLFDGTEKYSLHTFLKQKFTWCSH
ncbi:hypothetical protein NQ315_008512 [Exocentrus adspersus]|uniref:Aquaporin n=1 Tax=Exocentrus adspersus TaxID=1586481 RepID=A0AAV8W5Y5_9CUCU|nr:hypothetical protein NQ315_008512 [Exocentrus adspersus]